MLTTEENLHSMSATPISTRLTPNPVTRSNKKNQSKGPVFFQTRKQPRSLPVLEKGEIPMRNYFLQKIEKHEPELMLKTNVDGYAPYSKFCQSRDRRQPVILTETEFRQLRQANPEYANHPERSVTYGTRPDKLFTYICPNYWDLKHNKPISEAEMNRNPTLRQHIIPRNKNLIMTSQSYIYEFKDPNGKMFPFPRLVDGKHPDGYQLPCCYSKDKTNVSVGRSLLVPASGNRDKVGLAAAEEEEEKEALAKQKHIFLPDKFPLPPNRWGYLPTRLQQLLHQNHLSCQVSKTNPALKDAVPCLLRHGIVQHRSQSFLECLADVNNLSLNNLKTSLEEYVGFDVFLTLNNGNLVTDYYDPAHQVTNPARINRCKESKFYTETVRGTTTTSNNKPNLEASFQRGVVAYDRFLTALLSNDQPIPLASLWDLVATRFQCHLCIFEISDNEQEPQVQLLCPTNHYASNLLSSTYDKIVLLIKKRNFYEPIYRVTKRDQELQIERAFSKKSSAFNQQLIQILKQLALLTQQKCRPEKHPVPMPSPLFDRLQPPVSLRTALHALKVTPTNYTILGQVINYNSRVVGLYVEANIKRSSSAVTEPQHIRAVIPIQAVGIQPNLKTLVATDPSLYTTYENTIAFFRFLCKNTNQQIPCKLLFQIVEDNHVQGFLTEANQFVLISPPVSTTTTPSILDPDIEVLEVPVAPTPFVDQQVVDSVDEARVSNKQSSTLGRLKEESEQYEIFRNTLKLLLKERGEMKQKLMALLQSTTSSSSSSSSTVSSVVDLLHALAEEIIQFVDQPELPIPLQELNLRDNTRNHEPIVLRNSENEDTYYLRLADELLRNTRVREYVLSATPVVTFLDAYDVAPDELFLNQSTIDAYYQEVKDLYPTGVTEDASKVNRSYDETEPATYEKTSASREKPEEEHEQPVFVRTVQERQEEEKEEEAAEAAATAKEKEKERGLTEAAGPVGEPQRSPLRKELAALFVGADTQNELVAFPTAFGLFQSLLPEKAIAEEGVRQALLTEYQRLFPSEEEAFEPPILGIFKAQGKSELVDEIVTQGKTLKDILFSANYVLTTLDLWLLCIHYKVPCVLLHLRNSSSSSSNHEMEPPPPRQAFLLYEVEKGDSSASEHARFAFIVAPGKEAKQDAFKLIGKKANHDHANPYFYTASELTPLGQQWLQGAKQTTFPLQHVVP